MSSIYPVPPIVFVSPHQHGINASATTSHPFSVTIAHTLGYTVKVPDGITSGTFKLYWASAADDLADDGGLTDSAWDIDITGTGDREYTTPAVPVNAMGVAQIVADSIIGTPVDATKSLEVRIHQNHTT